MSQSTRPTFSLLCIKHLRVFTLWLNSPWHPSVIRGAGQSDSKIYSPRKPYPCGDLFLPLKLKISSYEIPFALSSSLSPACVLGRWLGVQNLGFEISQCWSPSVLFMASRGHLGGEERSSTVNLQMALFIRTSWLSWELGLSWGLSLHYNGFLCLFFFLIFIDW